MPTTSLTDTPDHNRMSTAMVVLTLSLLLGLQPITTDLYLPALPGLTQDLGASMAQAQLTLSALLLAFGGQVLAAGQGLDALPFNKKLQLAKVGDPDARMAVP